MQLKIDVNTAQVTAALSQAATTLADTQPLLAAIGQRLETNIRERFDTKTDPAGRAWTPYKAISSAIAQATTGKPVQGSLLERTGNLRSGVEHHVVGDAVEVGLTAPYGAFHELGTAGRGKKGGGAIPRRGMVFGAVSGTGSAAQVVQALSAADQADVMELIEQHVQRAVAGLK
jgi:phage virion morphogenesis protein